ncbi:MAG TPA: hypothetical protein VIM58_08015 [Candidatus Methylacidiphilales bacterium]
MKYPPELRQRLQSNATHLSCTFGHYVRECARAIDLMVESDLIQWPPMVVTLKLAYGRQKDLLNLLGDGERHPKP